MRMFLLAGILTAVMQAPASSQSCETIDVRDSYGIVVSSSQICVDENGAWTSPPAPQASAAEPSMHIVTTASPDSQRTVQTTVYPLSPVVASVNQTPSSVKSNRWQPTSGSAKRQALYAKLGLICVARKAMFCGATPCGGRCEGKQGWCDGRTGETYASLEAMERAYCKPKRQ